MKRTRLMRLLSVFMLTLMLSGLGVMAPDSAVMNVRAVKASAATVKISSKKKTVEVGTTFTLKVKGAKKKYTWTSSDPSIAKVKTKKGKSTKIVAVSAGKATITATLKDTTFKCVVTVKEVEAEPIGTTDPTDTPADQLDKPFYGSFYKKLYKEYKEDSYLVKYNNHYNYYIENADKMYKTVAYSDEDKVVLTEINESKFIDKYVGLYVTTEDGSETEFMYYIYETSDGRYFVYEKLPPSAYEPEYVEVDGMMEAVTVYDRWYFDGTDFTIKPNPYMDEWVESIYGAHRYWFNY